MKQNQVIERTGRRAVIINGPKYTFTRENDNEQHSNLFYVKMFPKNTPKYVYFKSSTF
jgi:hypothetical protein